MKRLLIIFVLLSCVFICACNSEGTAPETTDSLAQPTDPVPGETADPDAYPSLTVPGDTAVDPDDLFESIFGDIPPIELPDETFGNDPVVTQPVTTVPSTQPATTEPEPTQPTTAESEPGQTEDPWQGEFLPEDTFEPED